jgi:twitching motility protein PilI
VSAASAAFIKLAEYSARCRERSLQLPSRQDVVQYWSGIGFLLDGRRYVAPLEQVSEILTVPSYTRVPGVHHWMKGIANVRGRLMAVMDLTGFLEKSSSLQDKRRRLLVIDQGDLYTGLAVDDVFGIQHFPVTGYTPDPDDVDESVRPFLQGAYEKDGEFWQVFSIEHLAEDPRFLQVARTG